MNRSENINELASALSKAQGQLKSAVKDVENTFFRSKYADLDSVWDALRKPFSDNGLSISQGGINQNENGGKVTLVTLLMHTSGQWIESTFSTTPVKNDPQAFGSCVSYLRRYALAAIAGVTQSDDDANLATQQKESHGRNENTNNKPVLYSTTRNVSANIISATKQQDGNNGTQLGGHTKNDQITKGTNEVKKETTKEKETTNVLSKSKPEVSTLAVKAFVDKNWKATMYAKEVYDKVCEGLSIIKEREKIMYKPLPTLMSVEVVNQNGQ